jgi:transposase
MSKTEIEKLFEFTLKALRKTRIPHFSGKFSKKTYTQHQHLTLLVLKVFLRADYRKVCNLAEDFWASFAVLGLPKIPHFTTLQKFLSRIPNRWLEILIGHVLHHFETIKYLAIDSTGLECDRTSRYYQMRLKKPTWAAHFLKMSVLLDVKRRLPVAVCCHNRSRHDNRDFLPLMRKVGSRVKYFVADKAYDSERTLQFLKELDIKPIIPLRLGYASVRNRHRKKMLKEWASNPAIERQYHQRSLVESFFSSVKRRFGSEVRSRLWYLQRREAVLKVLVYSITKRAEFLFRWEVFYRASDCKGLKSGAN